MRNIVAVVIGGLLIALTGCSKSGSPTSPGSGSMQVTMVDAPASYDEVNIVVDSVQAHTAGSDSTGGWMTINSTPTTYNLLVYTNGKFAVVGDAQLPVGQYTHVRLIVGAGSNVVVNGQMHPLTIASGFQTGVKLNIDATIQANVKYTLALDFDANRSIVQTGDTAHAAFMLKPVIRTSTTATTGFISGVVLPPAAKATVWAYDNSGDTLSTNVNALGSFELMYVPAGTYTLHIMSNSSLYLDSTMAGISVTALATTNIGTLVLP